MRRLFLAVLVLVAPSTLLTAQSAPAAFEVASVKRSPTQSRGGPRRLNEITLAGIRVLPGGRVESYGHTLRNLIAWVYDVNATFQTIEGGTPALMETEFEISAKAAAPSLTTAEAKAMVRTLLEERFQLRWRWQPRASTATCSLLEAFRRELGLTLVKTPATINDFIIERLEPLIEN
jgi:hypothetical protein